MTTTTMIIEKQRNERTTPQTNEMRQQKQKNSREAREKERGFFVTFFLFSHSLSLSNLSLPKERERDWAINARFCKRFKSSSGSSGEGWEFYLSLERSLSLFVF